MNLTTLPNDIHYLLAQYMDMQQLVKFSLSCRYFYEFYAPFRKLYGNGYWPETWCNKDNYQVLKNIQKQGFSFKTVVIGFPLIREILANPPAESVGITIALFEYDHGAPIDWEPLLECKDITRISFPPVNRRYESNFDEDIAVDTIPGIIKNLSVWKKLFILEFGNENVDFNMLAETLPQSSVVELNISYGRRVQALFPIIERTNIKRLGLEHCKLTDQDLLQIGGYLEKWKIEKLSLSYNHGITEEGISAIANAITKSNLQFLDLSSYDGCNRVTFELAKTIFEKTKVSKLRGFNFKVYPHTLENDRLVAEYLQFFAGTNLYFEHEDELLYSLLVKNLKNSNANSIELKISKVLTQLPQILNGISNNSKIHSVYFKASETLLNTTNEDDLEFTNAVLPYINSFYIPTFEINGIRRTRMLLQHFTKKSNVREVDIIPTTAEIDLNDLDMIAEYLRNSNVYSIKIKKGIAWSDKAITKIAQFYKGTKINSMEIDAQGVTQDGIIRLAEELNSLNLSEWIFINLKGTGHRGIKLDGIFAAQKSQIGLVIQ
ncbi:hypothetical protein HK103_002225 [Boothiomyces macroporosus]|uniref:F-box domain-containing protein n=1 Tax=Boothiomyces macroporosus TaxID=261099 RepID=A0AAD5UDD2_9FUNG|nr:hypothetical protein HK103_002225 [Boothiomyces macroporosus]